MNYNYHTHTYYCRHALGTPEEYVKRAIERGIKYMGFSEHIPLKFSDGTQSAYRIAEEDVENYINEINYLKEKYKDQIEIKIGFESEYYPKYFKKMMKNAISAGAEYLILGVHFTMPENEYGSSHTVVPTDSEEKLKDYVKNVISAISTGKFTYIAHPDVINFTGDNELLKKEFTKLCKAAKRYNTPLEINFLGIYDNRNYPNPIFWEAAGKVGAPVTFGMDAHDALRAYDGESLIKAEEMVKRYKLNYIGKPDIKKLK